MKTLKLTLKRRWFDMIVSGEKKEEYRDIKLYWFRRLVDSGTDVKLLTSVNLAAGLFSVSFKKFDAVEFSNGYRHFCPKITLALTEIVLSKGEPQWGAQPNEFYFTLIMICR